MTVKEKFAAAKEKAQKAAPYLLGAGIVTVTAAVTLICKSALDAQKVTLELSDDDLERLKTGDETLHYSINGDDYRLGHIGNTPQY